MIKLPLSKKRIFLTGLVGSFILTFLALSPIRPLSLFHQISTPNIGAPQKVFFSSKSLQNQETYRGLPVANIKTLSTTNSWGTVIYIPQYHRSTGSDPQDKVNDAGARSQEQIYQILTFLNEKYGLDLVMDEGNLYGEVPTIKIATLADKIEKRNNLVSLYEALKKELAINSVNPSAEKQLLKSLSTEIAKIDREIILEGAPEKLKAEGKNIKLYGSENDETREEAKLVLRDYIFLQDRIGQLDKPQTQKDRSSVTLFKNNTPDSLYKLLSVDLSKSTQPQFKPLISQALIQDKTDLAQLLRQVEESFVILSQKTPETIMLASSEDTPSRTDNPYLKVTSEKQLKTKLSDTKEKMTEVVIEKRNKDTAGNFAKVLKEQGKNIGILQFGAGHKEGLIKELQSMGLSVIVITPEEVSKRDSLKG